MSTITTSKPCGSTLTSSVGSTVTSIAYETETKLLMSITVEFESLKPRTTVIPVPPSSEVEV